MAKAKIKPEFAKFDLAQTLTTARRRGVLVESKTATLRKPITPLVESKSVPPASKQIVQNKPGPRGGVRGGIVTKPKTVASGVGSMTVGSMTVGSGLVSGIHPSSTYPKTPPLTRQLEMRSLPVTRESSLTEEPKQIPSAKSARSSLTETGAFFDQWSKAQSKKQDSPSDSQEHALAKTEKIEQERVKEQEIGRAVQQECRDRSRMPSSA
eukprot:TRINITY_DN12054_c0_g1_i1.p1 TRINITY_DN12054_c0_g1~~TRINITY_DN12054_c0_g1_i1.p1  ORF type:complete len:210 (-),score=25.81 TRINITY_DN12054_c0_g1_i1:11-640(-)